MKCDPSVFKAYDIRGKAPEQLSPELAYSVGVALADFLTAPGPVAVGRDMRAESATLAEHVRLGLMAQGRAVWDLGLITSDMSYWAVGHYKLAGAAMITASHNDKSYNGIKLYREGVRPIGLDTGLAQIRDAITGDHFKVPDDLGTETTKDIAADWVEHVLSFVEPKSWPKYKVAIDAGNGMIGQVLPLLHGKTPLKITPMFFELDGTFPNHPANPEDPHNLAQLSERVVADKLDFGIAFDGDGDRAALVDDLGRPVSGSDLITMVARDYLEKYPKAKIVHDVRTSRSTREWIKKWGGEAVRVKAGRVSIGEKMRELDAPFGGETSGHLFFRDNYFADSGLIAALVAIQALAHSGKKLSELVDEYHKYAMAPEINLSVNNTEDVLTTLAKKYEDGEQDDLDGLTVNYKDWWFNIRSSNTEPVMRLNIEAKNEAMLEEKRAEVMREIEKLQK